MDDKWILNWTNNKSQHETEFNSIFKIHSTNLNASKCSRIFWRRLKKVEKGRKFKMPLIFSFSCLEDIWNRIHTSENLRHFQDNNPFGKSRFKLKLEFFVTCNLFKKCLIIKVLIRDSRFPYNPVLAGKAPFQFLYPESLKTINYREIRLIRETQKKLIFSSFFPTIHKLNKINYENKTQLILISQITVFFPIRPYGQIGLNTVISGK